MADYAINNVTRRVVYTGSAGVGPYAFTFNVLDQTDVAVYFNDVLLTLTTDYTVTVSAVDGTGSVTIVVGTNVPSTPTASDRITIVGARSIERVTDFVTGGDLFANTLNEELDSQTIFVQQVAEDTARALRAPVTDPTTIDMTLPINTVRANKTLAFDADGNPTIGELIGDYRGDWTTATAFNKRDLIKDTTNENIYICTVAHTSSGSLPISTNTDSAKWDLIVDASTATGAKDDAEAAQAAAEAAQAAAELAETGAETAQAAAELAQTGAETAETNAETAETNAEAAQAAAEAAQAAAEAIFDNFDDAYLGAKASDPTLDNDGNALADGALYFDTTNNVMKVYDLGTTTWYQLTPTVTNQNNINTVAGIASDVTTVATNVTDVVTFATTYLGAAASAPTTSVTGALYYDTSTNQLYVWDGSAWDEAAFNATGAVTSFNTRTGAITLSAADVNTALGSDAVLDSDIGVTVQAYDATIVVDADIGSTVQAYDADTAKTDTAQTYTAPQRGTVTSDNDLSFDQSATNNFSCTPTGGGTLTFTNHTAGQSGYVLLDNSGGYAITAAATTKITATDLTTISTAGVYLISYFDNGTNAYLTVSASYS
jgi:hypothetical protein